MENHGGQQEADTLCSTINSPGQSSGLAREVEVKVQSQKMVENIARYFANSLLRDTGEYSIPKLLEKGRSDSCCAI